MIVRVELFMGVRLYSLLDTVVNMFAVVWCLALRLVCSVIWSELMMMTCAVSCPLWSSVPENGVCLEQGLKEWVVLCLCEL